MEQEKMLDGFKGFICVHELDVTTDGKEPKSKEVFIRADWIYKILEMKMELTRGNNKESIFTSIVNAYGHAIWVRESIEEIWNEMSYAKQVYRG